jgi:hypothetical protein
MIPRRGGDDNGGA